MVVPGVLGVAVDVDVEERDQEHEEEDDYDDLLDGHFRQDLADLGLLADGSLQLLVFNLHTRLMVKHILSSSSVDVVGVAGVIDLLLRVDLLALHPLHLIDHDALGMLHKGRGLLHIGLILLMSTHHLLLQHALTFLLLLDLLSLLGVLV